jgi:hypothetical protein
MSLFYLFKIGKFIFYIFPRSHAQSKIRRGERGNEKSSILRIRVLCVPMFFIGITNPRSLRPDVLSLPLLVFSLPGADVTNNKQ